MRCVYSFIVLFCFISCKAKVSVKEDSIPVMERPTNPKNAVNDFAKVFSKEENYALEKLLRNIYDSTTNEICIVTLKTIDTFAIENVGLAYGKKWGIGSATKDNGIILLLSLQPQKVRIELGKGFGAFISNSDCDTILKSEVIPNLKNRKFYDAFDRAIIALHLKTKNIFSNEKKTNNQ
jgi:uncharacterized protein